jgi:hypothetical protein
VVVLRINCNMLHVTLLETSKNFVYFLHLNVYMLRSLLFRMQGCEQLHYLIVHVPLLDTHGLLIASPTCNISHTTYVLVKAFNISVFKLVIQHMMFNSRYNIPDALEQGIVLRTRTVKKYAYLRIRFLLRTRSLS